MTATPSASVARVAKGGSPKIGQIYTVTLLARLSLDSLLGELPLARDIALSYLRDFVKLLDLGVSEGLNLSDELADDIMKLRNAIHALTKRCDPEVPIEQLRLAVLVLELLAERTLHDAVGH